LTTLIFMSPSWLTYENYGEIFVETAC